MYLSGNLNFQLKQGELIPSDSAVVFKNGGNEYQYSLAEIGSGNSADGEFFVEGKDISGAGHGFGVVGKKEASREVSFVLLLHSKLEGSETQSEKEISGKASKGNDFTYQLSDGETVELKPKSVT